MPHDMTVLVQLKVRAADSVQIEAKTIASYIDGALLEPVENLEDDSYVVYGATVIEIMEHDR